MKLVQVAMVLVSLVFIMSCRDATEFEPVEEKIYRTTETGYGTLTGIGIGITNADWGISTTEGFAVSKLRLVVTVEEQQETTWIVNFGYDSQDDFSTPFPWKYVGNFTIPENTTEYEYEKVFDPPLMVREAHCDFVVTVNGYVIVDGTLWTIE